MKLKLGSVLFLSAIAVCGVGVALSTTCGARGTIGRRFDLDDVGTDSDVRAGLLRRFAVGTSEADVLRFVVASGLSSKAGGTQYYPLDKRGDIFCRFEDIGFLGGETVGVCFRFGDDRRLDDIVVGHYFTGL